MIEDMRIEKRGERERERERGGRQMIIVTCLFANTINNDFFNSSSYRQETRL